MNRRSGYYYESANQRATHLPRITRSAAVRFLLEAVDDPALAARVRDRLQLPPVRMDDLADAVKVFGDPDVPAGVARWLLESDDRDAYFVAFRMQRLPEAVLRDIVLGVPYGGKADHVAVGGRIPDREMKDLHYRSFQAGRVGTVDDEGDALARGLIEALRAYGADRRMNQVRHVAAAVGARDWDAIGAADRAAALPGYAHWALCVHPLCPLELRVQFGGTQPRYAKRMRNAGILLGGPSEYLWTGRNPAIALAVFGVGGVLFPERTDAVRDELRPMVERDLGSNLEAWAVLDRLLNQFSGSVPELIATSGAIAAGAGG